METWAGSESRAPVVSCDERETVRAVEVGRGRVRERGGRPGQGALLGLVDDAVARDAAVRVGTGQLDRDRRVLLDDDALGRRGGRLVRRIRCLSPSPAADAIPVAGGNRRQRQGRDQQRGVPVGRGGCPLRASPRPIVMPLLKVWA